MLREVIENIPTAVQFTMKELQQNLTQDFIVMVCDMTGIDVTKNAVSLTSADMEKIVAAVRHVYEKIFESVIINNDFKIFIANSFLCRLFELWRHSLSPELFFIKIRQNFTPAQIVAALELFMIVLENQNWVLNFFYQHKNVFPRKQGKIRTIGIYWRRMYSGGIERFLSIIIPIYIEMGYRVVLFTDEYKPELEYSLPSNSRFFSRITFKPVNNTLERFDHLYQYFKEYEVDIFIRAC